MCLRKHSTRLLASDFHLAYSLAGNGAEIYVMVGLDYTHLVEEAHETKMMIRLRETKGMVQFHREVLPAAQPQAHQQSTASSYKCLCADCSGRCVPTDHRPVSCSWCSTTPSQRSGWMWATWSSPPTVLAREQTAVRSSSRRRRRWKTLGLSSLAVAASHRRTASCWSDHG